jgi:hypothetical protein
MEKRILSRYDGIVDVWPVCLSLTDAVRVCPRLIVIFAVPDEFFEDPPPPPPQLRLTERRARTMRIHIFFIYIPCA